MIGILLSYAMQWKYNISPKISVIKELTALIKHVDGLIYHLRTNIGVLQNSLNNSEKSLLEKLKIWIDYYLEVFS